MAELANGERKRRIPWRLVGWGGAALLLTIPFVAMQLDAPGVLWTASDFIFMGLLFAVVGGLFELAVRLSNDRSYRLAFGLALLGSFLVVWTNLAVGIVGSDDNPANLWFFGALLVGLVGAAVVRMRPKGLSWTMIAMAVSLGIAFGIAGSAPTDEPMVPHAREFIGVSLFAGLFLLAAALFRRAAARQSSSSS